MDPCSRSSNLNSRLTDLTRDTAQTREGIPELTRLISQIIFWEAESTNEQEKHIPRLEREFHTAVLVQLENNKLAQRNAFRMAINALNEFNNHSSLGAILGALINGTIGPSQHQKQNETKRSQFVELTDQYSDYLSSVGFELVVEDPQIVICSSTNLDSSGNKDYQEFINKVNAIIDPNQNFIPENERDRELVNFLDTLRESFPESSLTKDETLNKLIDYFFNHYKQQDGTQEIISRNGSLQILPTRLSLNIKDGKKLVAFLASQNPNEIENQYLELIKSCVLNVFRDPFSSNISEALRGRRLEGLYSGINQFQGISEHLQRLGLNVSEIDEYITYSKQKILPQFVRVQEKRLLETNYGFHSGIWHLDMPIDYYSTRMEELIKDLEFIGSKPNAQTLYQECIKCQMGNLERAISDMQRLIKENSPIVSSQKLESKLNIAERTLQAISALATEV